MSDFRQVPDPEDEAAFRAAELHAQGKKFCLVVLPVSIRNGRTLYTVECREEKMPMNETEAPMNPLRNIERCCQLHEEVRIFYTVDGYQASLHTQEGELCAVSAWGEDVMSALLSLDAQLEFETLEGVRAKTAESGGYPMMTEPEISKPELPSRNRCKARDSGGVQCELAWGHPGQHACPAALRNFNDARALQQPEPTKEEFQTGVEEGSRLR